MFKLIVTDEERAIILAGLTIQLYRPSMEEALKPIDELFKKIKDAKNLMPENPWDDDEKFSRSEWREDVANGDTNLGYWDWVLHNKESSDSDQKEGLE